MYSRLSSLLQQHAKAKNRRLDSLRYIFSPSELSSPTRAQKNSWPRLTEFSLRLRVRSGRGVAPVDQAQDARAKWFQLPFSPRTALL